MHFDALKQRAVYQAVGDVEEMAELEPYVGEYVNEGYERLAALHGKTEMEPLVRGNDEPDLPEWMQPSIADWATWQLLRNGNPGRQQRGIQFRAMFEETVARALREGGVTGKRTKFTGIYP